MQKERFFLTFSSKDGLSLKLRSEGRRSIELVGKIVVFAFLALLAWRVL